MKPYYIISDDFKITYVGFFRSKEDAKNRYNDQYHNYSKDKVAIVLTEKEIGKLQKEFSQNLFSVGTI